MTNFDLLVEMDFHLICKSLCRNDLDLTLLINSATIQANMKYINLIETVEGNTSETTKYQLVTASQFAANGEWLADSVQTYDDLPSLEAELRAMLGSGNAFVVRGSNRFERIAAELGLPRLSSEWGWL